MERVKFQDEALVHLEVLGPQNAEHAGPNERWAVLTKESPEIKVGRSSLRKSELHPHETNLFFDCRVMSRDHAILRLDADEQKITIKDVGSMHGTFVNKVRLPDFEPRTLRTGDVVTFGVAIDHGPTKFHPFQVATTIEFGTEQPVSPPVTYRVPDSDYSDVEDISSDDDDIDRASETAYARKELRENNIRPDMTIDLTSNDDDPFPMEVDLEAAANHGCPNTTRSSQTHQGAYVDLTWSFRDDAMEDSQDWATGNTQGQFPAASMGMNSQKDIEASVEEEEEESEDLDWEEDESLPISSTGSSASDSAEVEHHRDVALLDEENTAFEAAKDILPRSEMEANHALTMPPSLLSKKANTAGDLDDEEEASFLATPDSLKQRATQASARSTEEAIHDDPITVESLGLKAGKMEYFEAREKNKKTIGASNDQDDGQDIELGSSILSDVGRPETLHDDSLVASSIRFINSPIMEEQKSSVEADTSVLDETSAYHFEKSKQATQVEDANVAISKPKAATQEEEATPLCADDGKAQNNLTWCEVQVVSAPPLKRKMSGMKNWTVRKHQKIDGEHPIAPTTAPTPPQNPSDLTPRTSQVAISHAGLDELDRPPKRLRRAAEVFGYAALGGIAVVSALIATAPTL